MLLVVGVALIDASITLGCRVDLHLRLDPVLPAPELSDLVSKKIMRMKGGGTFKVIIPSMHKRCMHRNVCCFSRRQ